MLPPVQSPSDLVLLRSRPERWRPAVAWLAGSLGFPDAALRDLGGGNLVVGIGDDHVLKLVPKVFERQLLGEEAALPLVAQRLPVATPRPRAVGELGEWRYILLTRVPGRMLKTCWDEVPGPERAGLLSTLGQSLAALHALPVPNVGALAIDWPTWLAREASECLIRQARWGVPAHLVDEMPACLASAELETFMRPVLLHADLHDENVMLAQQAGRWAVSGIIDFGDAMRGDPIFDLITPALLVARGDRLLLRALLDGYGAERTPLLHARLVAYAVLHRWNDLTRYLGWAGSTPASIEEFGKVLFPF